MEENNTITKIEKTWFIQRGDNPDDVFACGEQEAWGLFNNRSNWARKDFKIVGVSDGKKYVEVIRSGNVEIEQLRNEVQSMSRDLKRYFDTLDGFKFKELLSDTDEKVVKVKGIIKDLQDKVDEKNKVLDNSQGYVIKKAFEAELAVARGHIEQPQNFDVYTPHGNREKILKELGK
jgi:hypothetical protein